MYVYISNIYIDIIIISILMYKCMSYIYTYILKKKTTIYIGSITTPSWGFDTSFEDFLRESSTRHLGS